MTITAERDAVQDQLCARIDELEREKEVLAIQLDQAEEKADALAAHVERLFTKWNELTEEGVTHVELTDAMDEICGETPATSLARLKAQCWKEAYLAGMEAGHHWTVEGGYVAGGDEEAAEDYVADRQAEGGDHAD